MDNFFSKFFNQGFGEKVDFNLEIDTFKEEMESIQNSIKNLDKEFEEIQKKNFSLEATAGVIMDVEDPNKRLNLGGCNCENYRCSCCAQI